MGFRSRIGGLIHTTADFIVGGREKEYAVPQAASGYGGWIGSVGMGNGDAGFPGAWQAGIREASGVGTNVMANSAVYTCTNIISSDISMLPVQILRQTDQGNRVPHYNHPAWSLMQRPNSFQTSLQFIQQYFTSKLSHGNTYVLLLRDARYVVNEMYVLNPYAVQPMIADDGSVFYRISQDPLAGVKASVLVPATDILHDRCMTLPQLHPLVGLSPLFAAFMSAAMAGTIQLNSKRFFSNMSIPSGYLKAPGKIELTVAKKLQAEWEQNYSGSGIGRTAVLSNGFDYAPLASKAVDSDMVALLRWTVEDIARDYRVPPYMVGELSKATYRNSEQMSRDYFSKCLAGHIRSFEQCFNKALTLANGVTVEFDLSDLFRMESDLRYAAHTQALNAGWKSINEVRAEEDLPPVDGGEEPRVQMQYIPLSAANEPPGSVNPAPSAEATPAAPVAPAAPAPAKADEDPQLELDLDPVQMDLLVDAFVERFNLGDENGA